MKLSINNLLLGLIVCSGLSSNLACQAEKLDKRQERMMDLVKSMDAKIDFYGKVLDEQDQPVEGVNVSIHLRQFAPLGPPYFQRIAEFSMKSDIQGCFSLVGQRGSDLYIESMTKKGYEYSKKDTTSRSYDYPRGIHGLPSPDPKNPFVFLLRKKGEQTFVVRGGAGFEFQNEDSGSQLGLDLIVGTHIKEKDFEKPALNGNTLFCDLKAKATFDVKKKTWTIILSPGGPDAGVLVSDQILYQAPMEGYKPSATFVVESRKFLTAKHLYVRSRTPAIYTRIDLEDSPMTDKFVHLGGPAYINPYGDRNLELAAGLPGDVVLKLEEEIRTAFEHGARPPKPDLPRLIQESEKKKPLLQRLLKR